MKMPAHNFIIETYGYKELDDLEKLAVKNKNVVFCMKQLLPFSTGSRSYSCNLSEALLDDTDRRNVKMEGANLSGAVQRDVMYYSFYLKASQPSVCRKGQLNYYQKSDKGD